MPQQKILLWNGRHKGILGQARCPCHNKKYCCGMGVTKEFLDGQDAHATRKNTVVEWASQRNYWTGKMPMPQEKILLWNGRHKGIIGQARCPCHKKKYCCGMGVTKELLDRQDAHPTTKNTLVEWASQRNYWTGKMPIPQQKILLWNGRHKGILGQARCPSHNKKYSCGMGVTKEFLDGQDAHPTTKNTLVEWASCPSEIFVQAV